MPHFKGTRVQEPSLHTQHKSHLSALNEAWASVAEAKKELRSVDTRIRQTAEDPIEDPINWRPPKQRSKDNPLIERRIVYTDPQSHTNLRKENIPPASYPEPTSASHQTRFNFDYPENTVYAIRQQTYPDHAQCESRERPTRYEKRPINTSLLGRSLLVKEPKTAALSRLKEKIQQQKVNTSVSSSESGHRHAKQIHSEDDMVRVSEAAPAMEKFITRKVTTAPAAPSYKGFSEPHQPVNNINYTRTVVDTAENKRKAKKTSPIHSKGVIKKKAIKKGKPTRIVAPKKPTKTITTSSWRTGQEIQRKVREEFKKRQPVKTTTVEGTDAEKPLSPGPLSVGNSSKVHVNATTDNVSDTASKSHAKESTLKKTPGEEQQPVDLMEQSIDSDVEELDSEGELQNEISELKENKTLSHNAKSVLEEVQKSPDQPVKSETKSRSPSKKKVCAVVDTGLSKKLFTANKSPPLKRKYEEEQIQKRKVRHYDQDEVKKYMLKQKAERKKKIEEEKIRQKELKSLQDKKLQSLYEKQKAALKVSTEPKAAISETFIESKQKRLQALLLDDEGHFKLQEPFSTKEKSDTEHSVEFSSITAPKQTSSPCTKQNLKQQQRHHSLSIHSSFDDTASSLTNKLPTAQTTTQPLNQDVDKAKADRIASIRATASALRQRLDEEARRLTSLMHSRVVVSTSGKLSASPPAPPKLQNYVQSEKMDSFEIPGVHNIDEQCALINRNEEREKAAERIQALYRGYMVRRSLSWRMPSGRTLMQSLEEARRRAFLQDLKNTPVVPLASQHYPPVTVPGKARPLPETYTIANKQQFATENAAGLPISYPSVPKSYPLSKRTFAPPPIHREISDKGSVDRMFEEAVQSSKKYLESSDDSLKTDPDKQSTFPSYSAATAEAKSHKEDGDVSSEDDSLVDHTEHLRKILEKHKGTSGDKYSVINIFTRNYSGKLKQQLTGNDVSESSTTKKLLSLQPPRSQPAFTQPQPFSEPPLHQPFSPSQPTPASKDVSHIQTQTEFRVESSELSEQSIGEAVDSAAALPPSSPSPKASVDSKSVLSAQRNLLSPKMPNVLSDSDQSEKLFSPISKTPEPSSASRNPLPAPPVDDYSTGNSVIEDAFGHEINPVFTSTRRSPMKKHAESVNYNRGVRMSPNTLERRLRAEINLFDNMGDTMQQVDEMERIRNVVETQQESVALAQVLKAKQVLHRQEIDRNALEAREKQMLSSQDIEAARMATAEASARAMQAVAEVKAKSAQDMMENAQRMEQLQDRLTATTIDAAERVDGARQEAALAYKFTVDRQLNDVEKIAVAAASAASVTAVNTALEHHRLQLEELRKKSLAKITSSPSTSFSSSTKDHSSSAAVNRSQANQFSPSADRSSHHHSPTIASFVDHSTVTRSKYTSPDKSISKTQTHLSTVQSRNSTNKTASEEYSKTEKNVSGVEPKSVESVPDDFETENSSSPRNLSRGSKSHHSSNNKTENFSKNSAAEEEIISEERSRSFRPVVLEHSESYVTPKGVIKTASARSLSEELGSDKELTEALFSEKKTARDSAEEEVSLLEEESVQSEDRFHSSMTEDELKHEFMQVLPSENHRRKSFGATSEQASANETSSDELAVSGNLGKWQSTGFRAKHSKSPFREEDTFTKFTEEMVRQYIQEEGVRAKHQAALLALREKSIIEKTKAEMAFYAMQKRSVKKKKGGDEKMPPIAKKQRAVLMKLEAEKAEIKRQKESLKLAQQERLSMLHQQKEIARIRATTTQLWKKVGKLDGNAKETEEKEEDLVERNEESPFEQSSISQDIKKLRSLTSKKYLMEREKKLQAPRKREVNEILVRGNKLQDWRQRILEEERKLKEDIKRVLHATHVNQDKESAVNSPRTVDHSTQDDESIKSDRDVSSVAEDISLEESPQKSISEEKTASIKSSARSSNKSASRPTSVKSASHESPTSVKSASHKSDSSIKEQISSRSHKTASPKTTAVSPQSPGSNESIKTITPSEKLSIEDSIKDEAISTKSSSSKTSRKSDASSRKSDIVSKRSDALSSRKSSKKSPNNVYSGETFEDESRERRNEDDSLTEGTSDISDIEQRLKGLENEVQLRKDHLKHMRRKKEKKSLKKKERLLTQELQSIEREIRREHNKENHLETSPCPARTQTPRVLSPRNNLEFLSDRDTRRSLDFSESDSRSTSSVKTPRIVSPRHVSRSDSAQQQSLQETDSSSNSDGNKTSEKTSKKSSKEDVKSEVCVEENVSQKRKQELSIEQNISQKTENEHSIQEIISQKSAKELSIEESISQKSEKELSIKESISQETEKELSIQENISQKTEKEHSLEENISQSSEKDSNKTLSEKEISDDAVTSKSTDEIKSESKKLEDIYDDDFFESATSILEKGSETRQDVTSVKDDAIEEIDELRTESIPSEVESEVKSSSSVAEEIAEPRQASDELIEIKEKSVISSRSSEVDQVSTRPLSKSDGFALGDRVTVEGMAGTIQFIGCTQFSPMIVAGVMLDEALGTNNGTFNGKEYFSCEENRGLFTTMERLQKIPAEEHSSYSFEFDEENNSDRSLKSQASDRSLKSQLSDRSIKSQHSTKSGKSDRSSIEELIKSARSSERESSRSNHSPWLEESSPKSGISPRSPKSDGTRSIHDEKPHASEKSLSAEFSHRSSSRSIKSPHQSKKDENEASHSEKYIYDSEKDSIKSELSINESIKSALESIKSDLSKHSENKSSIHDSLKEELKSESARSIIESRKSEHESIKSKPTNNSSSIKSIHESLEERLSEPVFKKHLDGISQEKSIKDALEVEKSEKTTSSTITEKSIEKDEEEKSVIEDDLIEDTNEGIDVELLTDGITNSILKSLISETFETVPFTKPVEEPKKAVETEDIVKSLLDDAITHMICIKSNKEKALATQQQLPRVDLRGHQEDDDLLSSDTDDDDEDLDGGMKSLNEHLDSLFDSPFDDVVLRSESPKPLFIPVEEETVMSIPYTEEETRDIVDTALDELQSFTTLERLQAAIPSDSFLEVAEDVKNAEYVRTHKRLLFDVTKRLYTELFVFRHEQVTSRPAWHKARYSKTFSKFARKTQHLADAQETRRAVCEHVCVTLDIKPGRPSLEHFRRRIPLNLAKKDYVDAILVEELREEEVQWVNYDEDELRVKKQLADEILAGLLDECVTILTDACA